MKRVLFCLVFLLTFGGCTASAKGNLFVSERNDDVGRSVDMIYVTPTSISSYNSEMNKYRFEWDNGCIFVYIVNKIIGDGALISIFYYVCGAGE